MDLRPFAKAIRGWRCGPEQLESDSESELESEKNHTPGNRRGRGRVPPRSKPPNEIESLTERVENYRGQKYFDGGNNIKPSS